MKARLHIPQPVRLQNISELTQNARERTVDTLVSTQVYREIIEAGSPFYCYSCCLERQRKEISGLKDVVELLRREITELKTSSSQSSSSLRPCSRLPQRILHQSCLLQISQRRSAAGLQPLLLHLVALPIPTLRKGSITSFCMA